MASMSRVVALVLGQVGGEIGKGLAEGVAGHFDDPGQALPEAIRRAYGRAWQVIELALAGEELGGRLRLALASGEVRGVVAPVGRILAARGPEMRSACLREIKEARDHGALEPDLAVPTQESPLQRLEDPQGFLEAAWGAVRDLAVGLHRAGYVNLAQLVGTRMAGQPPLLVTAFGYFLRREVADDPRLAAGLNFDLLQRLWQGQEAGFGRLGEDLARWGGALQEGLKQVGGALAAVDAQVGETREAVLDLRRLAEAAQGEARALAGQVLSELQRLGAARG